VVVTARGNADSIARELGNRLAQRAFPSSEVAVSRATDFVTQRRLEDLASLLELTFSCYRSDVPRACGYRAWP
jgi:hypothetical protein